MGQLASPVLAQSPETRWHSQFRGDGAAQLRLSCSQTFTTAHTVIPFYSYLVKFDTSQGSKIAVRDLAKSWTISPDGLVYTFELHHNVKFHDGSALTSADVKATFGFRTARPPEARCPCARRNTTTWKAFETAEPHDHRVPSARREYVDARQLGVALQLHLQRGETKEDPKVPTKSNGLMGSGAFQSVEHQRGLLSSRPSASTSTSDQAVPLLDGFKAVFVKWNAVVPGMLEGNSMPSFVVERRPSVNQLLKPRTNGCCTRGRGAPTTSSSSIPARSRSMMRACARPCRWLLIADRDPVLCITFVKSPGGVFGYEIALPEAELMSLPGYGSSIEASRARRGDCSSRRRGISSCTPMRPSRTC